MEKNHQHAPYNSVITGRISVVPPPPDKDNFVVALVVDTFKVYFEQYPGINKFLPVLLS